jgi:hypothetical protein
MGCLTRLIKSGDDKIPEIFSIESKHEKLSHELRPGNNKKWFYNKLGSITRISGATPQKIVFAL